MLIEKKDFEKKLSAAGINRESGCYLQYERAKRIINDYFKGCKPIDYELLVRWAELYIGI